MEDEKEVILIATILANISINGTPYLAGWSKVILWPRTPQGLILRRYDKKGLIGLE